MLILLVGDDINKRQDAQKKSNDLQGVCDVYLKGSELSGLKQYLGQDIFGGKLRIRIENWNLEEPREILYRYIDDIKDSQNIFIIDESEMLDATYKKLQKSASHSYDCREIKPKDQRSFLLADYIIRKNKQQAWIIYMQILESGEPIESIIGAINYKLKMSGMSDEFMHSSIAVANSHDSKGNAKIFLEKLILNL